MSLPASSSRWMRVSAIARAAAPVPIVTPPPEQTGSSYWEIW